MKKSPEWFDLDNYLKPISKEEWAYHIYVRSKLFWKDQFKNFGAGSIKVFSILTKGNFSEKSLITSIHNEYSINYANHIKKDLEGFFSPKEPIAILSIEETVKRAQRLVNEFYYAIGNPSDQKNTNPQNEDPYWRIREDFEKIVFGNTRLILYSLDHTDAEILKSIKAHLKEVRSKSNKMYIFKESIDETLQEFHNFRLLALFDLLYWKEFGDPKLTYAMIGDLVWPEDVIEIDQRIRKKGLPLIKAVFHRTIAQKIYQNRN